MLLTVYNSTFVACPHHQTIQEDTPFDKFLKFSILCIHFVIVSINILSKMVAKHYFNQLEPVLQEEGDHHLQDFDEAEEETLSLCDLAVNSNSKDYWKAKEEYSQSASDDQDFFEFSSEDFTATSPYPKEDIIFCGKLIPYREPATDQEQTQNTNRQKSIKRSLIFPWKSNSLNKSRSISSKAQQQEKCTYNYKSLSQKNNGYEKFYDFSKKKVPSTAATVSAKPRWYLFAFGYRRVSTEMEPTDIKSRQRRRIPETMFRSLDGGGEMTKRSETRKRFSSWKCLWTFLKSFRLLKSECKCCGQRLVWLHSTCLR